MVSEDCKIESDQVSDQPFDQQNDQRAEKRNRKQKKKNSPTPPIKEKDKRKRKTSYEEEKKKRGISDFFSFHHVFDDGEWSRGESTLKALARVIYFILTDFACFYMVFCPLVCSQNIANQ